MSTRSKRGRAAGVRKPTKKHAGESRGAAERAESKTGDLASRAVGAAVETMAAGMSAGVRAASALVQGFNEAVQRTIPGADEGRTSVNTEAKRRAETGSHAENLSGAERVPTADTTSKKRGKAMTREKPSQKGLRRAAAKSRQAATAKRVTQTKKKAAGRKSNSRGRTTRAARRQR